MVGYTGGNKTNPTYENIDGHTEAIQIEYDPEIISFSDLLQHFFARHNPTISQPRRYRSVIFFQNQTQKKLSEKALREFEANHRSKAFTSIEPAGVFYPAEEYHQKYYEKHHVRGTCP